MSADELRDVPVLVLANKQDLPEAVSASQVGDAMQLDGIGRRQYHVEATIATQTQGLYEGLDWLAGNVEL